MCVLSKLCYCWTTSRIERFNLHTFCSFFFSGTKVINSYALCQDLYKNINRKNLFEVKIKRNVSIRNKRLEQHIHSVIMRNFLPKFTKRQWLTLIIIGLADFCNAICVSLQAPFFPQEVSFDFVIQHFGLNNILASSNIFLIKLFGLITRVKCYFRLSEHYNNNPIRKMRGHEIWHRVELKHKMCI